jgi:hypothetical protein
MTQRPTREGVPGGRQHRSPLRRGNDTPIIGERAATRGRSATQGGDEHAGVKRALSIRAPASRIGSSGGKLEPVSAASSSGLGERVGCSDFWRIWTAMVAVANLSARAASLDPSKSISQRKMEFPAP